MDQQFWYETGQGLCIAVKAQPGARHTAIGPVLAAAAAPGWPPGRLKVVVAAPPEEGKANRAIIVALAKWLRVKPSTITLTAGPTSREKRFLVVPAVPIPEI